MGYTTLKVLEMERAQFWGLRLLIVIFHDSLNYGEVTYRAYLWKKKSLDSAPCSWAIFCIQALISFHT